MDETGDSENTLIIEDNNIFRTGYVCFYVFVGYSKNNISFINNFITNSGKLSIDYTVNIAAFGGNNRINFTDNTIIGPTCSGINIAGQEGNNLISVNNNNIQGGGQSGNGFYLIGTSSKNTITLNNNNLLVLDQDKQVYI